MTRFVSRKHQTTPVRQPRGAGVTDGIVGQGLRLTAIGVVIGLFAAFAVTREMASMLVGIKATDPLTFVTMAVVFFLIAAISAWLPASRAAGLDPRAALQE